MAFLNDMSVFRCLFHHENTVWSERQIMQWTGWQSAGVGAERAPLIDVHVTILSCDEYYATAGD
jgi:hypothetical protein